MAVADYYMDYREKFWGHDSTSGNEDTFNKLAKYIWEDFEKEHEPSDGSHIDALDDDLLSCEEISWTGNGVNGRTINLVDSGLDIKFIRVWSEEAAYTYFRSEDMAGDASVSTEVLTTFTANWIESVGTGSFTIGDADEVNKSSIDYFAIVYGE